MPFKLEPLIDEGFVSKQEQNGETTLSIQTKRPLKTIEGQSLEGTGNIDLNKNDVGLGNVDNTTDLNKPISTTTQTALNTKQNTLTANSINNSLLSQMPANTIKVNATNALANAQDLSIPFNSVIGREATGNIIPIAIQEMVSGKTTLIAGNRTITDARITTASYALVTMSTLGVSTSVPIKFTANVGNMVFSTGQGTDTAEFAFIIFF